MSYIQPNTDIYILSNIPLNKGYEHTVYYSDKDTQANAFMRYQKHHLTNYSYQRALLGTIKVELKYEQLIDCNYMMFKNTNFENKWFYAFITGIGYISNDVTAIYYEIDVMQTWCYDYEFKPTFIERQHSTSDVLFENLQAEGLNLGSESYTYKQASENLNIGAYCVTIASKVEGAIATEIPPHNSVSGVYTGLYTYICSNSQQITDLLTKINNLGLGDSVVSFQAIPTTSSSQESSTVTVKETDNFQGYKPRNKKLLTYPYKYLEVYNNLGTSTEYKYEYGEGSGQLRFQINKIAYPLAQVLVTPTIYLNTLYSDSNKYSTQYSSFPTCAFASDTYRAWWAQNKNTYMANQLAIDNNYDTTRFISQNNYNIAKNNAELNRSTSLANVENTLTQAYNTESTNLTNYGVNQFVNTNLNSAEIMQGGVLVGAGALASASGYTSLGASTALSGASMLTSGGIAEGVQRMNNQAKINVANTNLTNATLSASNSTLIAENQYDTALKNATLTQNSAQLTALNTYQNATNQLLAKKEDMTHMPNSAKGNALCDTMNFATGKAQIVFSERQIPKEYAKIVDDYFDKYGYAQRRLYTPSRQNRKHWSYLKTVGCNIKGNMNQADLETIRGIYDNGITTWNNLEEVSDYTLDNTIG